MTTFAVIDRATGEKAFDYSSPSGLPIDWHGFTQATHDHVPQPDEPVPPAPAPTGPRRLTKTQFRDRFTPQEKVGIEFASLDPRNPEATLQDRLNAAQLRVFLDDVRNTTPDPDGTSIDLDDPRTIAAVHMLEGAGLIASGRAAAILGGA